MTAVAASRRTRARKERRKQLIEATMKCIARKGISGTTLSDVASEAGLSQGIVNLHFESKDNLLTETLQHLADDYKEQFDRALERAGDDPAERLQAVMELDFRPSVCDRGKLAVWFAFWGEVKSRPTYRRICAESDRYYDEVLEALCAAVVAQGSYADVSPRVVADTLSSLTNGLWLFCLINRQAWDRQRALDTVMNYLHDVFPRHFA